MRKSLIALALAAALPTLALAGSEGCCSQEAGHAPRHYEHFEGLKKLDLSKEQSAAVAEIVHKQEKAKEKLTKEYLKKLSDEDKAALRKDLKALRAEREQAVLKVLTPEQQKKYEAAREKAKAYRAEWEEFQKWKADKEAKEAKKPEAKVEEAAKPAEVTPAAKAEPTPAKPEAAKPAEAPAEKKE